MKHLKSINEYNEEWESIKKTLGDSYTGCKLMYRGVGMEEAIKSIKLGHLVYYSNDPMSEDWEVIKYGLGDEANEMSEKEIDDYIAEIVEWKDINKGVNLTTDLENAQGYSDIVFEVDVNGNYAEFSRYHYFAEHPNECLITKAYYKGEEISFGDLLSKLT